MAEKKENANINVKLTDDGRIKIDTNLNEFGAIHLLANAQQLIIERLAEENQEEEIETIEQ